MDTCYRVRLKNYRINKSKVYHDPSNTKFKHKEFVSAEMERLVRQITKDQDAIFLAPTQNYPENENAKPSQFSPLLGKVQICGH